MGATPEEFLRKLQDFDRLIRFAARRYKIPGVLDADDLYQEGLIILNMMFSKYDFSPDSDDFRKLFKTELWHGLYKVLQRHKQSKRDFRKLVNQDYSIYEQATDEELAAGSDIIPLAASPESQFFSREDQTQVREFIEKLSERLDSETRIILSELLYPREWSDIPPEFHCNSTTDSYWRRPKKIIPRHVIADMLGIPRIRMRRAVNRIRVLATQVADELGMDPITKAGLYWLTTRKKNGRKSKSVPNP